jgi:hypothetical protein
VKEIKKLGQYRKSWKEHVRISERSIKISTKKEKGDREL